MKAGHLPKQTRVNNSLIFIVLFMHPFCMLRKLAVANLRLIDEFSISADELTFKPSGSRHLSGRRDSSPRR